MENLIILLILAVIVGSILVYLYKAKNAEKAALAVLMQNSVLQKENAITGKRIRNNKSK